MCTAVAAVMGLQIASGLAQAGAARQEGKAKQDYYNFLADQNEEQANRVLKASDEQVRGIYDAAQQRDVELKRDVRRIEGRQSTVQAASGVWNTSRTAEDVARDTLTQSQRDESALRYNAAVSEWQTRRAADEQVNAMRSQASGYRYAGDQARASGELNAMTSILGTATNVASTWLSWGQTSKGASAPRYNPKDEWSPNILKSGYRPSSKLSLY